MPYRWEGKPLRATEMLPDTSWPARPDRSRGLARKISAYPATSYWNPGTGLRVRPHGRAGQSDVVHSSDVTQGEKAR